MNGQTALQSDLLARGMTKTTRILGVPFSYALGNIGLFVFVMMAGYAASGGRVEEPPNMLIPRQSTK